MVMSPVRVMVVDDSAFMRKVIREMLERNPLLEVVATAHGGREALELIAQAKPDVVTVDLVMPEMDGVDFIREQMRRKPLPMVVISSVEMGSERFLAAMEAGAVEFVQKPTALALDQMYDIQNSLVNAVMVATSSAPEKLAVYDQSTLASVIPAKKTPTMIDAVFIGVSTGGPHALRMLLPRFPKNFPVPIIVALHIPSGYTEALAGRLDELSGMQVLESENGLEMLPGRAILAKAGVHTKLRRNINGLVETYLTSEPSDSLYCPSVDLLFRSGGDVYKGRVLAVVMTGMGNDGLAGSAWIKAQGGKLFAESEDTCVVYGMPRSVVEAGLVDKVVKLDRMPEAIMEAIYEGAAN